MKLQRLLTVLLMSSFLVFAFGCDSDSSSDDGTCDPACTDGKVCQNGTCVDDNTGGDECDPACTGDQVCENGTCVDDNTGGDECDPACTGDQVCENGTCVDGGATGDGACENEADLAILTADEINPNGKAQECLLGPCGTTGGSECYAECIGEGMDNVEGIGLSGACATCYGTTTVCAAQKCLAECITDASSETCLGCLEEEGCTPDFCACAGASLCE